MDANRNGRARDSSRTTGRPDTETSRRALRSDPADRAEFEAERERRDREIRRELETAETVGRSHGAEEDWPAKRR